MIEVVIVNLFRVVIILIKELVNESMFVVNCNVLYINKVELFIIKLFDISFNFELENWVLKLSKLFDISFIVFVICN